MDTSLKLLKENGLRGLGILYSSSFNSGKKYFTESKWQQAFDNFKRAEELGEFVTKNGFSNNADKNSIDTFTVLYTGFAAQNNNKPADAIVYYEKLADRKIGTKEMADMYHYMLNHYSTQKNTEKFTKYLTLAKELYPDQNAKWSQIEMNNMNQTAGMDQIIGKYKQDDAAGKMTEDQYITYAQAFASPEKDQLSKLDSTQQVELKFTAADAFKKAFALNNNGIYAYNAGVLYYNVYSILEEKLYGLRGTSATLKAQREEVQKQQMPLADSAINWLEKGYTILKAKTNREKTESNSLNRAVDFLANLYAYKRDRSKGVNVKDVDKYDAKFKEYDNEHDKYKP
jgi:tetratricopeptide (TPR) repeat protein